MENDKLDAIAKRSAENLRVLFGEMRDDIQEAISAATEQAEEDGKETISLTLSHSIRLDLGKDKQEDTLTVSVRHKGSLENAIPDPNQPEFEGI